MREDEDQRDLITRREAILRVSALLGGVALVGQGAMLAGCQRREAGVGEAGAGDAGSAEMFTREDVARLDEIAETILPETDTPGAKAAGVGPFIAMMVVDCYAGREQQVFREGLQALEDECHEMHGAPFLSATPAERLALLEKIDAEQVAYMRGRGDEQPVHYFRMLKELTLLGYFTSEVGCKQAMRYVETPGRYDPCVPYEPGEKTWADHA